MARRSGAPRGAPSGPAASSRRPKPPAGRPDRAAPALPRPGRVLLLRPAELQRHNRLVPSCSVERPQRHNGVWGWAAGKMDPGLVFQGSYLQSLSVACVWGGDTHRRLSSQILLVPSCSVELPQRPPRHNGRSARGRRGAMAGGGGSGVPGSGASGGEQPGGGGVDYRGAVCLAPMVRVGTLPMRMLAAEHGATLTYSEELIALRLQRCVRKPNAAHGTVDFVDPKGAAMLRVLPAERCRLVAQLGAADAVTALRAAQVVCRDVAAIDVNMGCPQHFSVSGGMGAALLEKPETVKDILTTLTRNLDVPVTCKIRLLAEPRRTADLVRTIAGTGVAALGVHGRRREQRPRDPASWEGIRQAVEAVPGLPVIANGDVFSYSDVARVRRATGAAAVMIARGAQWNPSIFRPAGFLPLEEVKKVRKCGRRAVRSGGLTEKRTTLRGASGSGITYRTPSTSCVR